jgi:hypothetical protein
MILMPRAIVVVVCVLLTPAVLPANTADSSTSPSASYAVPPAFSPLRFGTVKPRGWILEQMRRDLREGFAGNLDELCHGASSDIFATGRNRPGKPNSGNAEGVAWWGRPGQLMMDIEVAGKVVTTVDSFQKAKGAASGYLFPATTAAQGRLEVRVCPHPGAPDQNAVVCGVLLFPGDAALDVDALIHPRGPKPLVTLRAAE